MWSFQGFKQFPVQLTSLVIVIFHCHWGHRSFDKVLERRLCVTANSPVKFSPFLIIHQSWNTLSIMLYIPLAGWNNITKESCSYTWLDPKNGFHDSWGQLFNCIPPLLTLLWIFGNLSTNSVNSQILNYCTW